MTILKRFEVWLLLALAAGATLFVLRTGGPSGDGADPGEGAPPPEEPADAPFTVDAARLRRDYGNAVLELDVTFRNDSGADLALVPPAVRLLSGPDPGGALEVNPFFLAFAPPPSVPAGESAAVVLKFWVEKSHVENALWLSVLDETRLVKSAVPLDLESIPNQESAAFEGTDWKAGSR